MAYGWNGYSGLANERYGGLCGFLLLDRFLAELRRHNYVTPTSYLELIRTFKKLLSVKRTELNTMRNRYLTGLEKLEFAAAEVGKMKEVLVKLQPELIATGKETDVLLAKVAKDAVQVEAQRTVVASDQLIANQQAAAAQSIKDECEADLAEALPVLNDAVASLDTLKQNVGPPMGHQRARTFCRSLVANVAIYASCSLSEQDNREFPTH